MKDFSAQDVLKLTKNIYLVNTGSNDGNQVSAIQKKTMEVQEILKVAYYVNLMVFVLLNVLPERFAENPKAPVDDLTPWSEGIRERYTMPG